MMKPLWNSGLASRYLVRLPVAAILAAVGLACMAESLIFSMFAHLGSQDVTAAMAAVALFVIMVLTWRVAQVSDQKRALMARQELFVTAQQVGKFGYWYFDIPTGAFTLSDNVHDLLGDPDRRLHLDVPKLLEMTHPDDRRKLADALDRVILNGTAEEIEYRITGLDGVEKTFWVNGKRMFDRAGKPTGAYGACQDITHHKRIGAQLLESVDHYRHAVELSAQIPWTADPDGNLLEMGPRWLHFIGLQREEGLGTGWSRALHPEDFRRSLDVWAVALESGEPYDVEYRLCHTDGSYRWFRARAAARRGDQGQILRWYGTLEDVHDRKAADAALRDSEELSRSILDSTTDCVKVLDLAGKVQFINPPGLQAMQIESFESVKGQHWTEIWPPEARHRLEKALDAARGGSIARSSGFCPTAKGAIKWWDVIVSPIFGSDGKPVRLLALSRDMTEAKRAQDEVEQARQAAEEVAQQLENVLSSTTDGVLTLNDEFRILYLNRTAQELLAQGRDLVGLAAAEALPDFTRSSLRKRLEEALLRHRPDHFEEYQATSNRWLAFHVYPLNNCLSIFFKDVSERRRAQEQLLHLAHHDALTGLVNRTILYERLDISLRAATPERQTAVLFMDLDEFKSVNDSLGHSSGDRLLIQVSRRLKGCVRDGDIVARFGGDEFAVIAEVSSPEEAAGLAERIIVSLTRPYELGGHTATVGVSIGILTVSDASVTADEAIRDADVALYRAKGEGRGIYRIFETAMGESLHERKALKQDLCGAVVRGEFSLVYQPLFNLRTNRVNGFEALLRWKHPTRGLVPPSVFIPLAEECGLIGEIGGWVLGQACHDAAAWPDGISVAVNLSPVQFRTNDLTQTVARLLAESGLPGERLQLEITESVLLLDNSDNLDVLHALRKFGITISMDDFGTGYSSLSYLRSFPFDKVKIDRAFVTDLSAEGGSGQSNAIVRAIIELAHTLGITTTAEGVENASHLAALAAMGCNEAQGFVFSNPVPVQDVLETTARLNSGHIALSPPLSRRCCATRLAPGYT